MHDYCLKLASECKHSASSMEERWVFFLFFFLNTTNVSWFFTFVCVSLDVSPRCPTNWEQRKRGQLDGDEKGVWLYTTRHCGCHLLAMHTDTHTHPYAHTHTLFKTHIRQATAAVLTFRTRFLARFQNVDINADFTSNRVTACPANITCINPPLVFTLAQHTSWEHVSSSLWGFISLFAS